MLQYSNFGLIDLNFGSDLLETKLIIYYYTFFYDHKHGLTFFLRSVVKTSTALDFTLSLLFTIFLITIT